ncbi:MAG TPA: hypothetical protein DIT13_03100 [Verrucomicrobiales bacterium]|nr:hypothetical protein [Verrucomicrobiales bacterium]
MLSRQRTAPASAQDFAAKMLGDLIGEGEEARCAHGANLAVWWPGGKWRMDCREGAKFRE